MTPRRSKTVPTTSDATSAPRDRDPMSPPNTSLPAELEARLRFETFLADLSSKFVNLPADQVDHEIVDAQRRICEMLDLDLSALWQLSDEPSGFFTPTHLYIAQKGPQPAEQQHQEDFPWSRQQMLAGRIMAISSLEDLPEEAARDRESMRQFGIKSNLTIPLAVGGGPTIGVLGLNTTRAERHWPDALVKRLQLVAQIFTNALARKRADLELRASEESLSLAAEAAGAGLWGLNLATNLVWVTSRTRELFEFTADEQATLERFFVVIHPEDRELVRQFVQTGVQTRSKTQVEYRIVRSDGSQRWMLSLGRVRCGQSGQPETLLGLSMDITPRKEAERTHRDNEARLAAAIDLAALGFYDLSLETKVLFVDDRLRALTGLPDEERHRAREFWQEHLHPEDRLRIMEWSEQVWRGEPVGHSMEYRYLHPQRGTIWLSHISRVQEQAADGRVIRRTGVLRDITGRKRAEEALRASEARLAAGMQLAGLGCYEIDHTEPSTFMDDRLGQICGVSVGYQQDFQRIQFWIEHVHPDDRERVWEQRQKLYAGEIAQYDLEYRYLHPTQGQKWIHHVGHVATRDAAGRAIRTYGALRDITGQKEAEAEMQRLRLQLWHADRVAQTGAITASLAHELNQPLTGILSTAQAGLRFLAGGQADHELIHELLTNIVHDTKRAGAVINGLRALMRRKETQREPVNLAAAIQEILDLLHSELVDQAVELRLKLKPDATVLADQAQLQQVVLNLAMNAVEAMHDQSSAQRRLEISLTQSSDGDALVAVCDSGPGIPEERQAKLFEAFCTTKPHGMGIGLAISRSIIESHGGRLWFANNADRGAAFYFTLPVTRDEGRRVTSKQ